MQSIKKEFDSKPMYDDQYIRTKIKIYNSMINTNFHSNKIPEDNECCSWISVILLYSVVFIDINFYPQIFLEEYKYAIKKKKIVKVINEELNLNESHED